MTLEQALNFRVPSGKRVRNMSARDWRQFFERARAERAMLDTIAARDITDEEDQHLHAAADRLDDLMTALGIICAEV
jgi:hypothetical protein